MMRDYETVENLSTLCLALRIKNDNIFKKKYKEKVDI